MRETVHLMLRRGIFYASADIDAETLAEDPQLLVKLWQKCRETLDAQEKAHRKKKLPLP